MQHCIRQLQASKRRVIRLGGKFSVLPVNVDSLTIASLNETCSARGRGGGGPCAIYNLCFELKLCYDDNVRSITVSAFICI